MPVVVRIQIDVDQTVLSDRPLSSHVVYLCLVMSTFNVVHLQPWAKTIASLPVDTGATYIWIIRYRPLDIGHRILDI